MYIIIKGKTKIGKTRSEVEENIRKEWGPTMSDANLDRAKFMEKRARESVGSKENFIKQADLEDVPRR